MRRRMVKYFEASLHCSVGVLGCKPRLYLDFIQGLGLGFRGQCEMVQDVGLRMAET